MKNRQVKVILKRVIEPYPVVSTITLILNEPGWNSMLSRDEVGLWIENTYPGFELESTQQIDRHA